MRGLQTSSRQVLFMSFSHTRVTETRCGWFFLRCGYLHLSKAGYGPDLVSKDTASPTNRPPIRYSASSGPHILQPRGPSLRHPRPIRLVKFPLLTRPCVVLSYTLRHMLTWRPSEIKMVGMWTFRRSRQLPVSALSTWTLSLRQRPCEVARDGLLHV